MLRVRASGLELGSVRLGVFKGPYGYVLSYAVSEEGILVESVDGLKCFIAIPNIDELEDALVDESCRRRVIRVRRGG